MHGMNVKTLRSIQLAAMRECIALHFDEHVTKRRVLLKDAVNRSDYIPSVADE